MRAVEFSPVNGRHLQVVHRDLPIPGPGEIRVTVSAAAVHPADVLVRGGAFDTMLPPRDRYRLGWDFAGTIDATGPDVTDLPAGTAVIGITNWLRDLNGTHAEHVVVPAAQVTIAPDGVQPAAAATLPVDATTAWQALDLLDLQPGQHLVIIGAAGAVGGFALELAHHRDVHVIGVGSASDQDYITSHGAAFVDRHTDLAEATRTIIPGGADALFDTASTADAALPAVRDGGRYCGVIAPFAPTPVRGITISTVGVQSDPDILRRVAHLAAARQLTLRVNRTYPFDDAGQAFAHASTPGTRGAILLTP